MPNVMYWGKGGQYGPFDVQEDGWPDAGQVMRSFREKRGITAKAFGKLYGKEMRENGKPICERWILEMELENKVPTDITRRRIIARLLSIPPTLLGLASLEDTILLQPQKKTISPTQSATIRTSKLQNVASDITRYEKNIRIALDLHRTSNAQSLLQDINTDIRDLECIEGQARGDFLYRVRELLVSNDLLATKIVKDQGQFALAYVYANNAVRVAKSLEDAELQAAATYTRGCTKLEWGLFGTTQQGIFQIDRGKAKDAIRDFQAILQKTGIQQEGIHPQLQGFTMLQLSRAQSFFRQSVHESVSANTLLLADQAAEMVGRNTIDDPYTRIIMTGTLSGLHAGGYHLIKAGIFNGAGLPGKAIAELQDLKKLTERTYGQDETRNQAWSDIVLAEAFLGLRRYEDAIRKAREALVACHHINSMQNVAIITDIYSRIVASPYGKSHDVKELGEMLSDWYDITSERNSER
jgi:tetratricopeptide (TPR) repeat protein